MSEGADKTHELFTSEQEEKLVRAGLIRKTQVDEDGTEWFVMTREANPKTWARVLRRHY